ncbi:MULTISPECIES: hypothetical protein [unclassified Archaeoglobus]|uniref:hypothetical protein n=1 Tax=unclassified Archaeoglobus TaxID=2643606 RepID=UPI0025C29763|nr:MULTISPECIES: hypothetical protein [unclassified Archaeoglobus]
MRECRMCSLDGTIQPEIVFEPLELEAQQIENLFGDANTRKVLKDLTGTFSRFEDFSGRLFVTGSGVVAISYITDEKNRTVVLVKVVGKNTLIYEVNPDIGFKVFFVEDDKISGHEFKLNSAAGCVSNRKCDGVCWAIPIYALLPELYPEVCDEETCSLTVLA